MPGNGATALMGTGCPCRRETRKQQQKQQKQCKYENGVVTTEIEESERLVMGDRKSPP